jgi:hypothetical protein
MTHSEHLSVESAVMGAQIEQLPDLAGYLKLASRPEWLSVRLSPQAATALPQRTVRATLSPLARAPTPAPRTLPPHATHGVPEGLDHEGY